MVNTPYEKDTNLSPPFTANRRRRLLGRGSPERGAVARRRLRGRPVGPLPPQGIKIRRRHLINSKHLPQKDRQAANEQAFRPVVPKCARQLHRRAVLGRKRLLLTPAAVCASPSGGYITAIAPILTQKPPIKTAA